MGNRKMKWKIENGRTIFFRFIAYYAVFYFFSAVIINIHAFLFFKIIRFEKLFNFCDLQNL